MMKEFVGTFPSYIVSKGEADPNVWVGRIHFTPDSVEVWAASEADFGRCMAIARERARFIGVAFPKAVIRGGFKPYEAIIPEWP